MLKLLENMLNTSVCVCDILILLKASCIYFSQLSPCEGKLKGLFIEPGKLYYAIRM